MIFVEPSVAFQYDKHIWMFYKGKQGENVIAIDSRKAVYQIVHVCRGYATWANTSGHLLYAVKAKVF